MLGKADSFVTDVPYIVREAPSFVTPGEYFFLKAPSIGTQMLYFPCKLPGFADDVRPFESKARSFGHDVRQILSDVRIKRPGSALHFTVSDLSAKRLWSAAILRSFLAHFHGSGCKYFERKKL
jgi:hypothetical protein